MNYIDKFPAPCFSYIQYYLISLQQQFFSTKSWWNWETKVSFRICSSRRFWNTPWNPKLTKIWWSNWLPQKPCPLLVEEKIREHDLRASITHSISDQIKFPGGILESSWLADSKTVLGFPTRQDLVEKNLLLQTNWLLL